MTDIYNLYWGTFQTAYIFITLTSLLLLLLTFMFQKKDKGIFIFFIWLTSLSNLGALYFISYFSGILYDELSIPSDRLLILLMFITFSAFLIETIIILFNAFRYRYKKTNVS